MIAVIEPNSRSFEHAKFNAALLDLVACAFPEQVIRFISRKEHADQVRGVSFSQGPAAPDRTVYITTAGYSPRWSKVGALFRGGQVLFQLRMARCGGASRVIFSSAGGIAIRMVELALSTGWLRCPVYSVMHGELCELLTEGGAGSLATAVKRPLHRLHRPILLGASIRSNLPAAFEGSFRNAVVIEHPYHWAMSAPKSKNGFEKITIGVLGNLSTRLQNTCHWADRLGDLRRKIRFSCVGFVSDRNSWPDAERLFMDDFRKPLSHLEFAERASNCNFFISLDNPDSYKLRASGTFMDSLSFLTPMFALRNCYIAECERRHGDIGYFGDSLDELLTIAHIEFERFPTERYTRMLDMMRSARSCFDPVAQAHNLRADLEKC